MLLDKEKDIIEALLFMKGEEGVSVEFFATFSDLAEEDAKSSLDKFATSYNKKDGAIVIKKFGNLYKMLLKEDVAKVIKKSIVQKNLVKLSKASLETLAIIAYNQPITKLQIDKIRGVSSDSILHSLVSRELIISTKTLDTIGKPKLYETTDYFLDVFGLESLEELPKSDIVDDEEINKFLENI